MNLEERLQELQSQGERQMVEDLVRGVIGGSDEIEMSVSGKTVEVTNPRFTGTHNIRLSGSGAVDIEHRGEYEFTGEDGAFSISVLVSNTRVVEYGERNVSFGDVSSSSDSTSRDALTDGGATPASQAAENLSGKKYERERLLARIRERFSS